MLLLLLQLHLLPQLLVVEELLCVHKLPLLLLLSKPPIDIFLQFRSLLLLNLKIGDRPCSLSIYRYLAHTISLH